MTIQTSNSGYLDWQGWQWTFSGPPTPPPGTADVSRTYNEVIGQTALSAVQVSRTYIEVIGPNVQVPPITIYATVSQEQPWHPPIQQAWRQASYLAPLRAPALAVTLTQELPADKGTVWLQSGLPAVLRLSVSPLPVIVAVEMPWHPAPFYGAGSARLSTYVAPVKRVALVAQEQPGHPPPIFQSGVAPSTTIRLPPVTRVAILEPTQPPKMPMWHPESFAVKGVPPIMVPPVRRTALAVQEPPWHPGPFTIHPATYVAPSPFLQSRIFVAAERFGEAPPPVVYNTPVAFYRPTPQIGRQRVVPREQPWHPDPMAHGSSLLAQLAPTQVPYMQVFV